jgi:aspartyl-tRNA(Asn)/glutamyl-tRNA(Gln) amidotransferase subunit C
MEITEETVDHIAHLARLEFKGEAKNAIRQDLSRIIQFMDKLSEIDTENVEPLIFMSDEVNVLREDVAVETITQNEALKNAPKKDSDYFRIPKVLDK